MMPDLTPVTMYRCSSCYDTLTVSGSRGDKYLVSAEGCSCKGFRFRQNCKHYEQWRKNVCGWDELYSDEIGERDQQGVIKKCPKCGRSVQAYQCMV